MRCTDQGRFLDISSFGSSETEVASQSSWMCFRDHQSGREFRCTFPFGFAEVGLMPGWAHVELCLMRGKTEGIIFCHPNIFFFQEVTKYCKNCKWLLSFIHHNFIYSFGPFRGFFPSDSHTMSQLSLGSFIEKIMCYSEILQSVISCQDGIPEMSRFN